MWQATMSRKEFGDVIQAQRLPEAIYPRQIDHLFSLSSGMGDDVEVFWKNDPRQATSTPAFVLVPEDQQREFMAWAASALTGVRPLSAYCRVLPREIASISLDIHQPPSLGEFDGICGALILCELATYLGDRRNLWLASPAACQSTLSFALSRAAALGLPNQITDQLTKDWSEARSLVGTRSGPPTNSWVQRVWSVLDILSERASNYHARISFLRTELPAPHIIETCEALWRDGEFDPSQLGQWIDSSLFDYSVRASLKGPREERMSVLQQTLNAFRERPPADRESASFLIAYLASAISPGTLDHLEVIVPLLSLFPGVGLWYGLVTGIANRSVIRRSINGLGRRVMREVLRDIDLFDAPHADLSLAELRMFSSSSKMRSDLRFTSSENLLVELFPSITVVYRASFLDEDMEQRGPDSARALKVVDAQLQELTKGVATLKRTLGVPFESSTHSQDRRPKRRSE
jgi:hypothetical protein